MRILIFSLAISLFLNLSCSIKKSTTNHISTNDEWVKIDIDNFTNIVTLKDTTMSTNESQHERTNGYPNPFSPMTVLRFELKSDSDVYIELYNLKGEQVITPYDSKLSKGNYIADFSNVQIKSGDYIVKLSINDEKRKNSKLFIWTGKN